MPTPERATEGLICPDVRQHELGRTAGNRDSPQSWLYVAGVMDDAAAVRRPVERRHAYGRTSVGSVPPTLAAARASAERRCRARRRRVHANEREISAIRRNDGVNVAEIRGRTRELASLTILERVQVDRRRGSRSHSDRRRPGACRPASTRAHATSRQTSRPLTSGPASNSRCSGPPSAGMNDNLSRFRSRTRTNAIR